MPIKLSSCRRAAFARLNRARFSARKQGRSKEELSLLHALVESKERRERMRDKRYQVEEE